MLHIVAFLFGFSVLAASHFPDHSLSLISANIYFFTFPFVRTFNNFFFLIISLLIVTLRITPLKGYQIKHHTVPWLDVY